MTAAAFSPYVTVTPRQSGIAASIRADALRVDRVLSHGWTGTGGRDALRGLLADIAANCDALIEILEMEPTQ